MIEIEDFEGISLQECPIGCTLNRCVITGRNHCGHPRKGGLQGADNHDQEAVERFHRARKAIGWQGTHGLIP
jgi:hypothetical protein